MSILFLNTVSVTFVKLIKIQWFNIEIFPNYNIAKLLTLKIEM